ncbi:hypothetical protein [Niallia sp. Krafla_26]|uniref:hypothetical protein n=1 Tax=Niallia sp. Krafla_26 TaxID=3064703 RepID=UPI003D177C0A
MSSTAMKAKIVVLVKSKGLHTPDEFQNRRTSEIRGLHFTDEDRTYQKMKQRIFIGQLKTR